MKRVVALVNASVSRTLLEGLGLFQERHGRRFELAVFCAHEIEEERVPAAAVREALAGAELVLLDLRGAGRAVGLAASALAQTSATVVPLVGGAPDLLRLCRMGGLAMAEVVARKRPQEGGAPSALPENVRGHAANWTRAMAYWSHGGADNVANLLAFLGREYLDLELPEPDAPREFPDHGLFDPLTGRLFPDLAAYRAAFPHDPAKPTLAMLAYSGLHFEQSAAGARALAQRLGATHNLLPVFSAAPSNLEALRRFCFDDGRPAVDGLVSFQWFQLASFGANSAETIPLLESLDAPFFGTAPMYGREEELWRESVQGFSPVEVMTAVIMPELDGAIEPLPTMALRESVHPATGLLMKGAEAIPAQMDLYARRVARRIALARAPNAAKRLAFIVYDTPPGEDAIGNASYLDVFASLRAIFRALAAEGYDAPELPGGKALHAMLVAAGAVNNPRWQAEGWDGKQGARGIVMATDRYRASLEAIGGADDIAAAFGPPPGEIMVAAGGLVVPGLVFGKTFLGLQPARAAHSAPETVTHDKTLPPHHQYAAFYRWLAEDFRPDAVIHMGTHGTLEFLRGKEAGLSTDCWPVRLIGEVPHFYVYHCVNASEAMIAKRRGLATIVNHASPPFAASGLYERYEQLEALAAEAVEARTANPAQAGRLADAALAAAAEAHLDKPDVESLLDELARMKRALIPKGLRRLDDAVHGEELVQTLAGYLRQDRLDGDAPVPALTRLLAEARGLDFEALLADGAPLVRGRPAGSWLAELDEAARQLVRETLAAGQPPGGPFAAPLAWALSVRDKLNAGLEIAGLLRGLAGGYSPPGIGGEPMRDPDVLPTGRNSFQFDPRLIPSEAAYRRGVEIARATLERCRAEDAGNGEWPRSVAVILWAFETAKTRGETVGQILGYLGVRPVRKSPWKTDLEVIPLAELGRPRVDVTVQICGFFRDMFGNVVSLINRAVELVSGLDESGASNFVRPATEAARLRLCASGHALADRVACARVFGPRPGEYGTRVTTLIETAAWKTEDDIVRTFEDSMNHVYADGVHGERQAGLYRERLAAIRMVSQVRDTNDYEISDLDHYYEYFGGLSRAVESVRGAPPVQLITDTTGERSRTETVGESLERGLRTRLFNPAWIDAMLEHEVHGAQKIGERVMNLIGFAATTHAVRDWVFSEAAERFVLDEAMRARLTDNNAYALEEIVRRLFEASRRGYWKATEDELERLREAALDIEGELEDRMPEGPLEITT